MRAVTFAGTGGNEVVGPSERPDPVPGSHEVLVAARFAGANWAEFPAEHITAALDHLAKPGKTGEVLLESG
ncbi:MAG TPA: hypothetical protein VF162_16130 [Streptosporangiaceae bacterium]